MPTIYITKTLGRNIVAGTIRQLPGTTIRELTAEHGDGWYELPEDNGVRRGRLAEVEGQTMVAQAGTRGRERKGVAA
jgi:hypothetical protein